ncbi:MAG: AmmeMemoRadiSam system radical SAM enzyme [Candidatus Zixiibacteriota bacterium]|nr:MAG: AmmeMemoRadiSam system radical SAM enzyme [candidate division Zixibacteria bacterium]
MKEAAYYETLPDKKVVCHLCPAECRLREGQHGICRSRFNRDGRLMTDTYGELVALAVDPIEKKPLYHFYPGSVILSTGPNACNLRCDFCQNWNISQEKAPTVTFTAEKLVAAAVEHDSIGVAFTYSEPLMWYEYLLDVAPVLREQGLKVVLVTNGYINPEPLEKLLPWVDAMNIDLKAINRRFYGRICKAKLEPVLATIRRVAAADTHLELTNLLIPGENDSEQEIRALVDFVASLSDMIPLHFSAYHPAYHSDRPPTDTATMLRARQLALEKLKYVYLGNVAIAEGANTYCPACGKLLIERNWYHTRVVGLADSRCAACGFETGIRR